MQFRADRVRGRHRQIQPLGSLRHIEPGGDGVGVGVGVGRPGEGEGEGCGVGEGPVVGLGLGSWLGTDGVG